VLAPFVTDLFNRSLSAGVFPTQFKAAFVTPLLKKSYLDPSQGKSYRPISNLMLSKTLERLVARQLVDYLRARKLLPELIRTLSTLSACLATSHLERFRKDIVTCPEVIGAHTLNFRPNFKFSRLTLWGGGIPSPLGCALASLALVHAKL